MTKEEFKSLVLPVKGKVYRLALTMLKSRQEAEDTTQDVYLKLWNMRDRLCRYRSLEALAVTITKNLCLDKLRSYRLRKQNDGGLDHIQLASTSRHDPALETEVSESMKKIRELIYDLPEQQRLAIHLRDIEQFSYEEIEEITGMTINNIRVAVSRARKTVRTAYNKHQNYGFRKN